MNDINPVPLQATGQDRVIPDFDKNLHVIQTESPRQPLPAIEIVLWPAPDAGVVDWLKVTKEVNDAVLKVLAANDGKLGKLVR
jgi:hypothetical protein